MPIRGGSGGSTVAVLDDLSDVIITSPTLADFLYFDGTNWVNKSSLTDWLSQYLLLAGRTTGQRIGSGSQTGNTDDIALSGRLTIGTGSFTANQKLTISDVITATVGTINQARI